MNNHIGNSQAYYIDKILYITQHNRMTATMTVYKYYIYDK